MRFLFLSSLSILLFFAPLRSGAGPVSLTSEEIQQLRSLVATNSAAAEQFAQMQKAADAALKETPHPVGKIVSEGHLASDPRKIQSVAALADMAKAESLAWAWAVTGEDRYAAQGRKFILAWAAVYKAEGNPINETKFEPMVVAYDLLRPGFTDAERTLTDAWLRNKAETLLAKPKLQTINWGSHRLKMIGLIGLTLKDDSLTERALSLFRTHVGQDLQRSGSSVDYQQRDALHYHLYTIKPMLVLARAAARSGTNLFDYRAHTGATLHRSVDFVVPFATGEKTHLEFAHSKVSYDRKRARSGETGYQVHQWDPKASIKVFTLAAWFSPSYGKLAAKIAGKPDQEFIDWQMVINAVSRVR